MSKATELLEFIIEHGPNVFEDPYENNVLKLSKELDWFLANKRLLIVRNKGRIVAVGAWVVTDTTKKLLSGDWPDENPNGEYMFVRFVIVHKNTRHRKVIEYMLLKGLTWFPKIKYLVYGRGDKDRLIKIKNILNRGREKEALEYVLN